MIDRDKVPEPTYQELISLFGEKRAHEIIIENNYNYRGISNAIIYERIVRSLRLRNAPAAFNQFLILSKKVLGISLHWFLIILGLIFLLLYIFIL